jgi:hypothetical protein
MSTPDIKVPEPAPAPEKSVEERKARIRDQVGRTRRAALGGIQSTILTGPAAMSAGGKTLLGQ